MATRSGGRTLIVLRNLLPLVGLVAIFCLAFFGEQGLMANHRLRVEMRQLRDDNERLRQETEDLREQVRRLREDPDTIERTIREELLMTREGEVVFTFQDEPDGGAPAAGEAESP